jgi:hypothetical protein
MSINYNQSTILYSYNFRFKRFKQGDFNLTNSPHPYLIPKVQIERLRELVKGRFIIYNNTVRVC